MNLFSLILFFVSFCKAPQDAPKPLPENWEAIPLQGNGWFCHPSAEGQQKFGKNGLQGWAAADGDACVYFSVNTTGAVQLGLNAKGTGEISVTLNGETRSVKVSGQDFTKIAAGAFKVKKPGYQTVTLQTKGGVDITDLLVQGDALKQGLTYVKDDFYWGRRGPSVHMKYEMPEDKDFRWIYNEITVPEHNDVIGSYFMANGFGEGYFGIQVNSGTERRILFSVWSPFKTDDPKSIPEDQRIVMLKKGEGVNTGEFGNEGSGGQSYKRFNWKAGNTYRFLTRIEPSSVQGSTEYTAYFFAPETGKWELIASFRRPATVTYAKRFHSFLENFVTGTGHIRREVAFSNQWACDTKGAWTELTKALYTADATARKGNRIDYAAGVKNGKFFLANCGFFSPNVPYDTGFERKAGGTAPVINFAEIEKL
ncbi:MAG: DUF3472 domain-containing protein [Leadbetterella sp.]|nr:DUF3472 domain-containing protein [Leadbetterella sp.]